MLHDVVIIGSGLFGSIIGANLRKNGRNVLFVDAQHPEAGSKAAACLMKPSWLSSSMSNEMIDCSMEVLNDLYGVEEIKFDVAKILPTTVNWVNPAKILKEKPLVGKVSSLVKTTDGYLLKFETPIVNYFETIEAKKIIIAAGVWTPEIIPLKDEMRGLAGVAFVWKNLTIEKPFISPWAPYKQLVAFNRGDGLWMGDGSSILRKNWTSETTKISFLRCAEKIGRVGYGDTTRGLATTLFGIRPYTKGRAFYLHEPLPNVWVATGGAKNGTAAAGWCAYQIERGTR
jgi:glycine/D-amino acid oxidase-like deaminating enzyme